MSASQSAQRPEPLRGLLVDWGGVMTASVFSSFRSFCEGAGIEPRRLRRVLREDPRARAMLAGFEEGRVSESDFEEGLAELLGVESAEGLIEGMFSGLEPDEAMVRAVRLARAGGVGTGMISNSWGTSRYPRELFAEIFDGVVISGEVGIRKPALRIYALGAEAIGREPRECVYVDDLEVNLAPARELGMRTIHHRDPQSTIRELEELLGMALS